MEYEGTEKIEFCHTGLFLVQFMPYLWENFMNLTGNNL